MEKASRVMYSIANFFNWLVVLLTIAGIVLSALAMANVLPSEADTGSLGLSTLIICIVILLFCLITIAMVRKAKKANSSKGWDVLFIVLGILDANIFYVLGGIFGLVARR